MNFTLFPIIVLGGFQSVIAILLLAPLPVARIGINLCRATTTPVGKTFLGTISVFLLVLLVPPVRFSTFNTLCKFPECMSSRQAGLRNSSKCGRKAAHLGCIERELSCFLSQVNAILLGAGSKGFAQPVQKVLLWEWLLQHRAGHLT